MIDNGLVRSALSMRALPYLVISGVMIAFMGLGGRADEPPADLIKTTVVTDTIVKVENKRTWLDWETRKQVHVTRRERQDPSSPWSEQTQDITTSYWITSVAARCNPSSGELSVLALAGVFDDGTAVIERWRFVPPPMTPGSYVPLENRPLPQVQNSVVYLGTELGRISSLELDPAGNQFVLFLTFESRSLYKAALPASAPQMLYDPASIPALSTARGLRLKRHVTEGPKYVLDKYPNWHNGAFLPTDTVVLSDPDDDGSIDLVETLTPSQWDSRAYGNIDSWTSITCE